MNYVDNLSYKIVPTQNFQIVRGCAGCGSKQNFLNREHFRVNANGNRLDVWLIFGCEKCGHTYNLPIYERVNPGKIPKDDYQKFLANDKELAFQIGISKEVFAKNRAEIARDSIKYELVPMQEEQSLPEGTLEICLYNPYDIPVRVEKIVAEILHVTRAEAKRRLAEGKVIVSQEKGFSS